MDNETRADFEDTAFDEVEAEIEKRKGNPVFGLVVMAVLVALLADIVTVYIVHRFRRLKKQHSNMYFFHISLLGIMNFLFMALFLTVESYRKAQDIDNSWWFHRTLHLLMDIIISLLFAQFSLLTIMTIDWYMFTFAPQKSAIFRKYGKSVIVSTYVYVVAVSLYSVVVTLWYGFPGFLSTFLLLANFLFSLILYLVFGLIYLCRRKNLQRPNSVVLRISSIRSLLWFFLLISIINGVLHARVDGMIRYIAVFFLMLALLSPVVQLILLFAWDQNYTAALTRIFDCRKSNQGEDIENLEDSEEEGAMAYNASNGEVIHRLN